MFRRRVVGRGAGRGAHAGNERRVEIVEYPPDGASVARQNALTEVTTRGMRGLTGTVYAGDKGDPTRSFYGAGPRLQDFTGAANAVGNPIVFRNTAAELDNTVDDEDPVRRLLAQRRGRRR